MLTLANLNISRLVFSSCLVSYSKRMASNKCLIGVCQLTVTNNKESNLEVVKRLVQECVEKSAKVVFLPEATDYIAQDKNEAKTLSESLDGNLMNEYRNIAKGKGIWLSIGGFHERINDEVVYNSHVIIDNTGEIKSIYRKIHLFDVAIPEKNIFLRESDLNVGGSQILLPISTPAGALASAICYDLRFPELSSLQTKLGAEILTYPSAFTNKTGEAHWETLLRARAIENQCYVIAAAQYGRHNKKRISYGQSLIVDPWGKILAQCPKYAEGVDTNESIAIAEIDLDYLRKVRTDMPVQKHRRNDIYSLNLIGSADTELNDKEVLKFADKNILGSTVFYKSQYCYAFTNIRCVVPGHVLIATQRVAQRLVDLSQEETSDLFQTVVKIQKIVETEHKATSSTICVQDGQNAGQTVPHVHVHILPRKQGDFANNDDVYMCLAKHDKEDGSQQIRPIEEMVSEAQKLRNYFK